MFHLCVHRLAWQLRDCPEQLVFPVSAGQQYQRHCRGHPEESSRLGQAAPGVELLWCFSTVARENLHYGVVSDAALVGNLGTA